MGRKKYSQEYYRRVTAPRRAAERTVAGLPEGALCHYCGSPATELDHFVSARSGGDQLVPVCVPCNRSKGARDVEDWRKQLARSKSGCPYFSPAQREYLGLHGFDVDSTLEQVSFHYESREDDIASLVAMGATRMR